MMMATQSRQEMTRLAPRDEWIDCDEVSLKELQEPRAQEFV